MPRLQLLTDYKQILLLQHQARDVARVELHLLHSHFNLGRDEHLYTDNPRLRR